jgi:hypothetical protein
MTDYYPIPYEINKNLKIEGNFESEKYIENIKKDLTSKLCLDDEFRRTLPENHCIINFRGGEFLHHPELGLKRDYYTNAIDFLKSKVKVPLNFYVVTDDVVAAKKVLPDIEVLSNFGDIKSISNYPTEKVKQDMYLVQNAPYLILANSSFSWWGAWTNTKASLILAPKYWARHNLDIGIWSTYGVMTNGWLYLNKSGDVFDYDDCMEESCSVKSVAKRLVFSKRKVKWWN